MGLRSAGAWCLSDRIRGPRGASLGKRRAADHRPGGPGGDGAQGAGDRRRGRSRRQCAGGLSDDERQTFMLVFIHYRTMMEYSRCYDRRRNKAPHSSTKLVKLLKH